MFIYSTRQFLQRKQEPIHFAILSCSSSYPYFWPWKSAFHSLGTHFVKSIENFSETSNRLRYHDAVIKTEWHGNCITVRLITLRWLVWGILPVVQAGRRDWLRLHHPSAHSISALSVHKIANWRERRRWLQCHVFKMWWEAYGPSALAVSRIPTWRPIFCKVCPWCVTDITLISKDLWWSGRRWQLSWFWEGMD